MVKDIEDGEAEQRVLDVEVTVGGFGAQGKVPAQFVINPDYNPVQPGSFSIPAPPRVDHEVDPEIASWPQSRRTLNAELFGEWGERYGYPHKDVLQAVVDSVQRGIAIHAPPVEGQWQHRNHRSAEGEHAAKVGGYLDKEVEAGRMANLGKNPPSCPYWVVPLGSVEKLKGGEDVRRVIADLSYPRRPRAGEHPSLNSLVDKEALKCRFGRFDDVVSHTLRLRFAGAPRVYYWGFDFSAAFRSLAPARWALGWFLHRHPISGDFLVDLQCGFGYCGTPHAFIQAADVTAYIAYERIKEELGAEAAAMFLSYYMDDSLGGHGLLSECKRAAEIYRETITRLGWKEASEKTDIGNFVALFTGINIDSESLRLWIAPHKYRKIVAHAELFMQQQHRPWSYNEAASLAHRLARCATIQQRLRPYLDNIWDFVMATARHGPQIPSKPVIREVARWTRFLRSWDGVSSVRRASFATLKPTLEVYCDASGSTGGGGFRPDGAWFYVEWLPWQRAVREGEIGNSSTTFLEAATGLMAMCTLAVPGTVLRLHIDNSACVLLFHKGSARTKATRRLGRLLATWEEKFGVVVDAVWTPREDDRLQIADLISKARFPQAHRRLPGLAEHSMRVSPHVIRAVMGRAPSSSHRQ